MRTEVVVANGVKLHAFGEFVSLTANNEGNI